MKKFNQMVEKQMGNTRGGIYVIVPVLAAVYGGLAGTGIAVGFTVGMLTNKDKFAGGAK